MATPEMKSKTSLRLRGLLCRPSAASTAASSVTSASGRLLGARGKAWGWVSVCSLDLDDWVVGAWTRGVGRPLRLPLAKKLLVEVLEPSRSARLRVAVSRRLALTILSLSSTETRTRSPRLFAESCSGTRTPGVETASSAT